MRIFHRSCVDMVGAQQDMVPGQALVLPQGHDRQARLLVFDQLVFDLQLVFDPQLVFDRQLVLDLQLALEHDQEQAQDQEQREQGQVRCLSARQVDKAARSRHVQ